MSTKYESYPLSQLTGRILACCVEVHKVLGPGFEEVFYQRALAKELQAAGLEFLREQWMDVSYKGERLGTKRVDFILEECMVEIKAKGALEDVDKVQTLSYLKASGYQIGLLVNFGAVTIEVKRIINTPNRITGTPTG